MGIPDETAAFHETQRFKQIEAAGVVPDRFHGSALKSQRFEIGLVIGEQWIGRREADVAAPGEFHAVLVVRAVTQTDHNFLSQSVRLVQTKHAVRFVFSLQHGPRNQQEGRNARAGSGSVGDKSSNILATIHFLFDFDVEWTTLDLSWQRSQDLLHGPQNFRSALVPVADRFNYTDFARWPVIKQELSAIEARRRRLGSRRRAAKAPHAQDDGDSADDAEVGDAEDRVHLDRLIAPMSDGKRNLHDSVQPLRKVRNSHSRSVAGSRCVFDHSGAAGPRCALPRREARSGPRVH